MKITNTYNWNRRDFSYDATCEHCGHITKDSGGYDDYHYYNYVMPEVKCPQCGENSNSKATDAPKTVVVPKYNENVVM